MFYPTGWIYSQGLNLVDWDRMAGSLVLWSSSATKDIKISSLVYSMAGVEKTSATDVLTVSSVYIVKEWWKVFEPMVWFYTWLRVGKMITSLELRLFFWWREWGLKEKSQPISWPCEVKDLRHSIQHIPLIFPAPNMTIDMWFVCDRLWWLKAHFLFVCKSPSQHKRGIRG